MSAVPVADFYRGKNVFITGGTGFVGICLIEKLLRCTEVNNIYLLVRPKKALDASARLEELKSNSVFFELVKSKGNDVFDKLAIVGGDVGEENLGLSVADRQTLIDNVQIVFHSAATLDFGANLKTTVSINLLGTQRIVALCKQIRDLKALLHVSSAYVNSHMLNPDEKIYPVPKTAHEVIELVQSSNEEELEAKTPFILGEYINTYTFTKALAEQEVAASISHFPSTIIRPSQITAAWKEPVPGWTISKNGPQGFLMGATKGVVRRLPVDQNVICDYIPVDVVVNGMVVGAWYAATSKPAETPIFHLTTSTVNPFSWSKLVPKMDELLHRYPLKGAVWYPTLKLQPTLFMFRLSALIFHWIPAYLIDTFTRVMGGRPILVRMHTNINNSLAMLEPFIFTEWKYTSHRTQALQNSLSDEDKKDFSLDVKSLVWEDYFDSMALGVRTYLHKENPNSIAAAKKKDQVLRILNYIVQAAFLFIIWIGLSSLAGSRYTVPVLAIWALLSGVYAIL